MIRGPTGAIRKPRNTTISADTAGTAPARQKHHKAERTAARGSCTARIATSSGTCCTFGSRTPVHLTHHGRNNAVDARVAPLMNNKESQSGRGQGGGVPKVNLRARSEACSGGVRGLAAKKRRQNRQVVTDRLWSQSRVPRVRALSRSRSRRWWSRPRPPPHR